MTLSIGTFTVGPGNRCFVIAEIAQAHDGSLGTAHAYVDAAANAGASAIKFQTHIAAAESTPSEPFRIKFSRQDANRYDYWKRMEFSEEQWVGLAEHARERGLVFLSSAFSFQAVDLLERIGMPAWKVGSGETSNLPMIERMAKSGRPVLLSSGLSPWGELDEAVACVRRAGAPVGVLQCTTSYPCPPERLGLNVLGELRARYSCPVGLSDHSATIYAGLAAVALGADLLEVHVAFTRDCFGPDTSSSVTTAELAQLTQGVAFLHRALTNPIDKDRLSPETVELRRLFGKGLVAARDLPAGHRLTEADLALKKPAAGIPAARLREVVDRRLRRALAADAPITEDVIE